MKLNKGVKMPDFQYLSPYAEGPQSFAEYANGKKTFVVFLRYYGCTVCRLDLHIFAQRMAEFTQKGAQLMVVLQSDPNLVKEEAPLGTFPYELACDPSQDVYKKFDIDTFELSSEKDIETKAFEMANIPFEIKDNFLFNFILFKLPNGSGGFIVSAKELNRNYIGCDINPRAIEIVKNRLE